MAMKAPGLSQLRPPLNYETFVLCSVLFFFLRPSMNLHLLNTAVAMVTDHAKYTLNSVSVFPKGNKMQH